MKKNAQFGMTLLESLIALSVFSVVLWAAMANYTTALSTLYGARLFSDIQSIRFSLIGLHHGQSSYGNSDLTNMLFDSNRIPLTFYLDGNDLSSMDGSLVSIIGDNDKFAVHIQGTSKAICMQLLGRISAGHWLSLSVADFSLNSVGAQTIAASAFPLSNDALLDVCTGDNMSISLVGR